MLSEWFCFLILFWQIAAFMYYEPIYKPVTIKPEQRIAVPSTPRTVPFTTNGNSLLMQLPQRKPSHEQQHSSIT
jgi:hypothetical protein